MGWAYGVLPGGKEVGYSVSATCEEEGCEAQIDRGLSYACGTMHGNNCGGYFCPDHLFMGLCDYCDEVLAQVCKDCLRDWELEHFPSHPEFEAVE